MYKYYDIIEKNNQIILFRNEKGKDNNAIRTGIRTVVRYVSKKPRQFDAPSRDGFLRNARNSSSLKRG